MWKFISVGHTKFLVKVELTWVQHPGDFPEFSSRLPIRNTLNISYKGESSTKYNNQPC